MPALALLDGAQQGFLLQGQQVLLLQCAGRAQEDVDEHPGEEEDDGEQHGQQPAAGLPQAGGRVPVGPVDQAGPKGQQEGRAPDGEGGGEGGEGLGVHGGII